MKETKKKYLNGQIIEFFIFRISDSVIVSSRQILLLKLVLILIEKKTNTRMCVISTFNFQFLMDKYK